MKKISIVVAMYNESKMVDLFFVAVDKVINKIKNYDFEIVAVNDGSTDNTLELLKAQYEKRNNLVVVNLSRNFGHEPAIYAGLKTATGDAVIPMDADLQDPPEVIFELVEEWEKGNDVVNAKRGSRKKDSGFKRSTADIYYKVMNKMSPKVKIPQNVGNFRLIDRKVVDIIIGMPESNKIFRILVPYVGFKVSTVIFDRPERVAGESKYPLSAMVKLAVDSIVSLTNKPLEISIGVFFFFLGSFLISSIIQLVLFILHTTNVLGPLNTLGYYLWLGVNIFLFLASIISLVLTILSIYVSRMSDNIKNRPFVIIDEIYKKRK